MIYEQPNVQYRCGKCGCYVYVEFVPEKNGHRARLDMTCPNQQCEDFNMHYGMWMRSIYHPPNEPISVEENKCTIQR